VREWGNAETTQAVSRMGNTEKNPKRDYMQAVKTDILRKLDEPGVKKRALGIGDRENPCDRDITYF